MTPFTGERLHAGDDLFAVDLARHRAAYRFARERLAAAGDGPGLDVGSGSGYGTRELAAERSAVGVDRVYPDRASPFTARFVRGDLLALPFRAATFAWAVSFQVIEHLEDPHPYLAGVAALLRPGAFAIFTTPNRHTSDGVNPFHVHEYTAPELHAVLSRHFAQVELLGITTTPSSQRYLDERARRVAILLRLDVLRLRQHLPRAWIERLFGHLAIAVRRSLRRSRTSQPTITWRDFPVAPHDEECLDLLAVATRGPTPMRLPLAPSRSC